MFALVLYECEPWFFTLRENHREMVFVNMVLRKIFRSKRKGARETSENCEMRSL